MKKAILTVGVIAVLLATLSGCKSDGKRLFLPEAKNDETFAIIGGADGPTSIIVGKTEDRAEETTLTFEVEGEKELVSAKLHKGNGYSLYLPTEGFRYEKGFDDGNFEETWESTANDEAEIQITVYENTTAQKAQSTFLREHDNYIFEDLMGYPLCGREADGDVLWFRLYESGKDVYIVSWEYPSYAEEGFGARLAVIANTFMTANE